MADISSLYPQPGGTNMLGVAQQVVQLQNAANQNRMFQEKFASQKAMAEMAQQSVDQKTGEMDWNKFATLISTSPLTAITAPEVLNQIAQRKLTDANALKMNLENEQTRMGIVGKGASALVALGKNPTKQDLIKILGEPNMMRALGGADKVVGILQSAPEGGQALYQWGLQHMMIANTASDNLSKVIPQFHERQTGAGTLAQNRDPLTGEITVAPGAALVQKQPTYEEEAWGAKPRAMIGNVPIGRPTNAVFERIPGSKSPLGEQVLSVETQNVGPDGRPMGAPVVTTPQVGTPTTGENISPIPPQGVNPKAYSEAIAKQSVKQLEKIPDAIQGGEYMLSLLDQVKKHPGLETATGVRGTVDPRNYVPGTDAYNFKVLLDQVQGQSFLKAYETLKGTGQITEIEGVKATQAIARMNRAQSTKEFLSGTRELEGVVSRTLGRLKQSAQTGGLPVLPKSRERERDENDPLGLRGS